jgi:thioredoxin reductase (NADPH)
VEELLARLADWCRDYGYPVLFAFVILENAGVPLPGETAVLVAGFLASEAGGYRFGIGWVILLTFVAAVLGDNLGFWAGRRWARPYLQQGRRFLLLTPAVLKKADSYFERWGSWTIFVARFITGLRVVGALAAGTAGMPWRRFLIANAGGAITWATAISLLGFFFGENLRLLEKLLGRGGLIALSALLVVIVAAYSWNRWIRSGPKEPPAAIGPSKQGQVEQASEGSKPSPSHNPRFGGITMPEKVVIIGSGPAAWTAAIYAARANLQPLVFEGAVTEANRVQGTLPLGQLALTTEVENYPGLPAGKSAEYLRTALPPDRQPYWVQENKPQPNPGINGPEMMELMRQQAVNFDTRIITDDIVKVNFQKHPFVLTSLEGKVVESLAVIIATGARANYLGLPSEDRFKNNGVSACAVCDGALPRFRNKPLVVIGGGDSAVEEGTYLSKFASKVFLVHRRDQLRASKILQQRAFDNAKIEMKWNRTLEEVLGNDKDGVTGVRLKSTVDSQKEELDSSGLFLAIGHTPNTDFLEGQVELDKDGYIRWTTPQRTFTSVEGVFSAGDVSDNYYRQAVTAAGTGCMAALDAERWLAEKGWL